VSSGKLTLPPTCLQQWDNEHFIGSIFKIQERKKDRKQEYRNEEKEGKRQITRQKILPREKQTRKTKTNI
jgi:hypothetical protein